MKTTILSTEKLCKTFSNGGNQQHVIVNLDLEIYEKDFTIIMGPSGAGKSTLLYALSGMDKATMGKIHFGMGKSKQEISQLSNDQLATFRRDNCGFVFQQPNMLDNMNILDNILINGLLVSKNRKEITARGKQILSQLNIDENTWLKFPQQVSGGEAQRSAIARALINSPKILFADEPTGALNSHNGKAVLDVLTDVNNRGETMIMVTHDIKSARRGNRVLYFQDGHIAGEVDLGKYSPNNKERSAKLQAFLIEMGW